MYEKNPLKITPGYPVDRAASIRLVHYSQSYYCDFQNREGLLSFFEDIEGRYVSIGIETSDSLLEGLDVIRNVPSYTKEKINKKTSYIEWNLKKTAFIQHEALINFIVMIAEINDLVFIAADPPPNTKLVEAKTRKLIIDTRIAPLYAVFNYDAESLIVFE